METQEFKKIRNEILEILGINRKLNWTIVEVPGVTIYNNIRGIEHIRGGDLINTIGLNELEESQEIVVPSIIGRFAAATVISVNLDASEALAENETHHYYLDYNYDMQRWLSTVAIRKSALASVSCFNLETNPN